MRFLIVAMLIACSSTPKEPTLTPKQQGDLCRPAVDHLVEVLTSGSTGDVPMAARIRTALQERCTVDKWGADAVDCFLKLQAVDKADGCARFLTVPQRDGFQQAIEGAAR